MSIIFIPVILYNIEDLTFISTAVTIHWNIMDTGSSSHIIY